MKYPCGVGSFSPVFIISVLLLLFAFPVNAFSYDCPGNPPSEARCDYVMRTLLSGELDDLLECCAAEELDTNASELFFFGDLDNGGDDGGDGDEDEDGNGEDDNSDESDGDGVGGSEIDNGGDGTRPGGDDDSDDDDSEGGSCDDDVDDSIDNSCNGVKSSKKSCCEKEREYFEGLRGLGFSGCEAVNIRVDELMAELDQCLDGGGSTPGDDEDVDENVDEDGPGGSSGGSPFDDLWDYIRDLLAKLGGNGGDSGEGLRLLGNDDSSNFESALSKLETRFHRQDPRVQRLSARYVRAQNRGNAVRAQKIAKRGTRIADKLHSEIKRVVRRGAN